MLVALILKLGWFADRQAEARALLIRAERISGLDLVSTGAAGMVCLRTIAGIFGGRETGRWIGLSTPDDLLAPRFAISANDGGRGDVG